MPREESKRALEGALLERLVALNAERAEEEQQGLVRWLRPEFQHPEEAARPAEVELEIEDEDEVDAATKEEKKPWPKSLPEQVRHVADVLASARSPLDEQEIAQCFTGRGPWKRRLPQIVETLVSLGRARRVNGGVLGVD